MGGESRRGCYSLLGDESHHWYVSSRPTSHLKCEHLLPIPAVAGSLLDPDTSLDALTNELSLSDLSHLEEVYEETTGVTQEGETIQSLDDLPVKNNRGAFKGKARKLRQAPRLRKPQKNRKPAARAYRAPSHYVVPTTSFNEEFAQRMLAGSGGSYSGLLRERLDKLARYERAEERRKSEKGWMQGWGAGWINTGQCDSKPKPRSKAKKAKGKGKGKKSNSRKGRKDNKDMDTSA